MTNSSALDKGRDVIRHLRQIGAKLNGADESLWFVQGALGSIHELGNTRQIETEQLGYAVYIADLLSDTCPGVTTSVIETEQGDISEVVARNTSGRTQNVLTWVRKCSDDPNSDNIIFKYASALNDYGQHDRAQMLFQQLEEYASLNRDGDT